MNWGSNTLFRAIKMYLVFCCLFGSLMLTRSVRAQAPYYDIQTIYSYPTYSTATKISSVTRVNSSGMVAYTTATEVGQNPLVYHSYLMDTGTAIGHSFNVAPLPGNYVVVQMNDNGWICGVMPFGGTAGIDAYVYVPSATNGLAAGWNQIPGMGIPAEIQRYLTLGLTGVQDINNSNQVVGLSYGPTNTYHAAVWTPGTTSAVQIFTASTSYATAISDRGDVIGTPYYVNHTIFAWSPAGGAWSPVGGLSYPSDSPAFTPISGDTSVGYSINSKGEIAGYFDPEGLGTLGTLWLPNPAYGLSAGAHLLPTNRAGGQSAAYGINDYGNVVTVDSYSALAQIWSNGAVYDLNYLMGTTYGVYGLQHPYSINNRGQIVVAGYNGNYNTFLLTPKFHIAPTITLSESTASPGDTITAAVSTNMPAPFDMLVNVTNPNPAALSNVSGTAGPTSF